MTQDQGKAESRAAMPTELNPFLIQLVAVGIGADLAAARDAATGSLRKRATQIRTQLGFPTIHGMHSALIGHVERFSEPGKRQGTQATLAAWYHLDVARNVMTPLPHRLVGPAVTGVIQEYDVVFCEGY